MDRWCVRGCEGLGGVKEGLGRCGGRRRMGPPILRLSCKIMVGGGRSDASSPVGGGDD